MYITRVEKFGKSKVKVYIDEECKFCLYSKELSKYKINENDEITEEEYEKLYQANLTRAKKYTLNILKMMDKTRYEIIRKLKQAGYNDEIIDKALEYINSYNYIDDARYASKYVRFKRDSKSKREIMNLLLKKGVSKDIIEDALFGEYKSEEIALIKTINKRKRGKDELSEEDKRRLMTNLCNKGFDYELIKKHLQK
ncbi:MAG TPA: regulatory protein RecX [Clostridiales bacterium]|nr:regulatory protein RecX [Clostridiales bacterium]